MSKEIIAYKNQHPLEIRKSKAAEILSRGNIPVIAIAADTCCLETRLMKYEVPGDANFAQLIYSIRRGIQIKKEEGLYIFVGNTTPTVQNILSQTYELHSDPDDGYLYVLYSNLQDKGF